MGRTKKEKDENAAVKNIRFYRLVIMDHQTHKHLWSQKFSKMRAIVTIVTTVVCLIILTYVVFAFTPLRTTIPGYPSQQSKKAAVQNAIRMDSLEKVITRWELYSENVRRVIEGREPLNIDSLVRSEAISQTLSKEEMARRDSILRKQVVAEEQFELSNQEQRDLPIEGILFFSPLKGVISQGYDEIIHPSVDITAPKNSVVTAVLDGTVIFDGWSDEAGYTIGIQHSGEIISIYKHNDKLLKKTGEKVSAGTPIALIGGTGSLSTGDHLHFELWYKGEALDPTKYINF